MKNEIASKIADPTEVLLHDLIAECHGIIHDGIMPAAQAGKYKDWHNHINDVTALMASAVELADAVGRLRSPAPPPELRQRITVERVETRPPQAPAVQRLPAPGGRGVGENG